MARETFVDTGFWTALIYPQDQYHSLALSTWEYVANRQWPIVTTNWTLYETLTLLSCSYGRHDQAIQAFDFVSRLSEVVRIEGQLENRSLEIFRRHSDKRWSVIDCANFACIEQRQCQYALSYDRNFEQAQLEFNFLFLRP